MTSRKKSCGPVVLYTGLPTQFGLYIVGVGSIPMEENDFFFFPSFGRFNHSLKECTP